MTTTDARTADLLDPAWWVDLDRVHEFFTWARREAPVYRDEANGLWVVTRHADLHRRRAPQRRVLLPRAPTGPTSTWTSRT